MLSKLKVTVSINIWSRIRGQTRLPANVGSDPKSPTMDGDLITSLPVQARQTGRTDVLTVRNVFLNEKKF